MLIGMELALASLAVYVGVAVRFYGMDHPDEIHTQLLLPKALFFAFVIVTSLAAMGRYQRLMNEGFSGELLQVGISFVVGLVAMSMLFYVFPGLFIGRGAFGYALVFSFWMIVAVRYVFFRFVIDTDLLKRRVIVFGMGEPARLVTRAVIDQGVGQSDCQLLGYWPVSGETMRVDDARIIWDIRDLPEYAQDHDVDEVVIALEEPLSTLYLDEIQACKYRGIRIMDIQEFCERERHIILTEVMDPGWWLFHSVGLYREPWSEAVKKLFDTSISLLLLLILSPVMLLAALAIWIEGGGRGPIFYTQSRVGIDGRIIPVLKFRSMRTDAEQDGVARWAAQDDARVTRVGRFIRKSRIDELPQFFNVLRGEMSLVGPRPERPEFVTELKIKIPFYTERLRVKPGITGWAQIRYGYGASEEDAAEKLKYDLYYVKNRGLFLDLLVLIHTVEVVLFGQGATGPKSRN
ncbi:hypothetical protein SIID45300_00221 [Candidatus Magnetaquicoccaceae bacterium FCR-1]|uniref:Bacterial sugar transferase domain-containing protein n=2 Tax=Candidatus Magnetaquiglobus chichijimensis TaxID=3141448 RepID=A0ABQ0C4Y2_9PROT